MPHLSCSIGILPDNGMLDMWILEYAHDDEEIKGKEHFTFYSHLDKRTICDEYDRLTEYVKNHSA